MTAETCEHCGLTPKSDWPIACRYAATLRPEIREGWRRSGADAPCACDAFDEEQAELQASAIRRIAATFAALIAFVVLTWFSLRG